MAKISTVVMEPEDKTISDDRIWEATQIAMSEYPAGWLMSWQPDNSLIIPRDTVDKLSPEDKTPPPKPGDIDTGLIDADPGKKRPRGVR